MDRLSKLAEKYGTDKFRHYTPFYDLLLKDFHPRRILEFGILRGASLRMWRDYFPEARVYGADSDSRTLFSEERIRTFLCNQASVNDVQILAESIGAPLDLVVDDGSHEPEHQWVPYFTLQPYLADGYIYIIEDVHPETAWKLTEKLESEGVEYTKIFRHWKGGTGRAIVIHGLDSSGS